MSELAPITISETRQMSSGFDPHAQFSKAELFTILQALQIAQPFIECCDTHRTALLALRQKAVFQAVGYIGTADSKDLVPDVGHTLLFRESNTATS